MYFACRVCLAIAFICSSMFLLAGRAYSQIQFNTNPNLNYSPAVAPCKAAISAKIQADHGTFAHFEDRRPTVQRDTSGNTRVGGAGEYLSSTRRMSFFFTCEFDEHSKTVTLAFYKDYAVDSERLVPPENQAQDCQEKTIAKIYARDDRTAWTNPKSIVSKTNKNGDRIIYGDGVGKDQFKFDCTYRDGRLVTFDYWYLPSSRAPAP